MSPIQLHKLSSGFGLYMWTRSSKPISHPSLRISVHMVSIWDYMEQKENHHQFQGIVRETVKLFSRAWKKGRTWLQIEQ